MDLLEALECCHAYGCCCVQVEDKICACHGDECAFVKGGKPVRNGAHGVLANAVVNISAAVVSI